MGTTAHFSSSTIFPFSDSKLLSPSTTMLSQFLFLQLSPSDSPGWLPEPPSKSADGETSLIQEPATQLSCTVLLLKSLTTKLATTDSTTTVESKMVCSVLESSTLEEKTLARETLVDQSLLTATLSVLFHGVKVVLFLNIQESTLMLLCTLTGLTPKLIKFL